MAKMINFNEDARRALERGVTTRRRGQGHPRPARSQRRPGQEVRRADRHQRRRHHRPRDRARRPVREPRGAAGQDRRHQDQRRRGRRHHHRHRARPGLVAAGLRNVAAGANPTALGRGIQAAADTVAEFLKDRRHPGRRQAPRRRGRHDLRAVSRDRRADQRGPRGRRQGRRDHRRGGLHALHGSGRSPRVVQFDKGYLSPYFVTDAGVDGGRAGGRLRPAAPRQDLLDRRPAAAAGEGARPKASRC